MLNLDLARKESARVCRLDHELGAPPHPGKTQETTTVKQCPLSGTNPLRPLRRRAAACVEACHPYASYQEGKVNSLREPQKISGGKRGANNHNPAPPGTTQLRQNSSIYQQPCKTPPQLLSPPACPGIRVPINLFPHACKEPRRHYNTHVDSLQNGFLLVTQPKSTAISRGGGPSSNSRGRSPPVCPPHVTGSVYPTELPNNTRDNNTVRSVW